jgi:AcrR family transcriptional regulator
MLLSGFMKKNARPRAKATTKYHHGSLRRALLDATLSIVEREGTGAVSLSAAARRVGVSPQASYNHFRKKGDLLAAAAEEAVRALAQAMREARNDARSPGERFEATGLAYVRFATEHGPQFRLLSAPELADKSGHPSLMAAYEDAFDVLLAAVEESQRGGVVRNTDARKLALAAWSTVHGVAWLLVDGQLSATGTVGEPSQTARSVLRLLFKGLKAP